MEKKNEEVKVEETDLTETPSRYIDVRADLSRSGRLISEISLNPSSVLQKNLL